MYKAYVTYVSNIRPAANADRLNTCEVFGNITIIDKTITKDTLVLYLPSDGQISVEFGEKNNLFRRKDDAGNNVGGFIDPDKRNITAIRLRGNRSDGLVLPISCLNYCFSHGDASIELRAGDVIDGLVNGHEICCKYIPHSNTRRGTVTEGNRTRNKKVAIAPLFREHADTEQLAYNLNAFKPGDEIEITLKMHGTSQRTGYLPVLKGYADTWSCRVGNFLRHIMRKMGCYHGEDTHDGEPIYDYGYVSGTRRVVLENYESGFYGDNEFREQHSKVFEGKLWKGETAYYEVVAYMTNGVPIMGEAKVPMEARKQYGNTMVFSYGCSPNGEKIMHGVDEEGYYSIPIKVPQSDIYVYRMTMTNPDGEVVEYTPDFMRYRCEQMAVKTVPVLWKGIIPKNFDIDIFDDGSEIEHYEINAGEWIKNVAEQYYDGPDPIGKTHVREGVVARIINRPKFTAYKHKNFLFKQVTGIIKDNNKSINSTMTEDILEEL